MGLEHGRLRKMARATAVFAVAFLFLMAEMAGAPALAQVQTETPPVVPGAKPAIIERIKVHSPSLEGNLEGNPADRDVIVVLPPSYRADPARRYPVVYALHGYFIGAEQWIQEIHVPQVAEGAFASGVPEMIVVLPDSKTLHLGSVYSSSPTTGNFENFVATDLVAYIDGHYRTIPQRESRGLVGHSMGGYGATRIGMKHADVFGALYIMSPGGLEARPIALPDANAIATLYRIATREEGAAVEFPARGLDPRKLLADEARRDDEIAVRGDFEQVVADTGRVVAAGAIAPDIGAQLPVTRERAEIGRTVDHVA